jgi:hypothetical protein
MKVWRYQDWRGYGPYIGTGLNMAYGTATYEERRDLCHTLNDTHRDCPKHPGAYADYGWRPRHDMVFGFPTEKKAMEWFRGFHRKLKACGFALVCLDVPTEKVLWGKSRRQVCFSRENAA